MIDDLRDQSQDSSFFEDSKGSFEFEEAVPRHVERRIFGMTGVQRLIIAAMLFMMTCILGILILLVAEAVVL